MYEIGHCHTDYRIFKPSRLSVFPEKSRNVKKSIQL